MTGSKSLEDSIDSLVAMMKDVGLENVRTEDVTVPDWERGYEAAELLLPRRYSMNILGLGTSVGTPPGGLVADAVVVESFDEFDGLRAEKVKGKIVVFVPQFDSYSKTTIYRQRAASVASKKGALAVLVRSLTSLSIGSPHTGSQKYVEGVKKIPAASITVEDAEMLLRMYHRGETIRIHLELEDRNLGPTVSRNTIAELEGRTDGPVVVLSGHIDSWDVGAGALDDGGGSFISWKAIEFLKKLNLRPRRTIRSILWTAEEQGSLGSKAYHDRYRARDRHTFNFFFESDSGTFDPKGMGFKGNAEAECIFKEILKLMTPLNATEFVSELPGAPDLVHWVNRGFPAASPLHYNRTEYFWFHHTAGDSMLVMSSRDLDKNTALFAAASFVIADLSVDMPKEVSD